MGGGGGEGGSGGEGGETLGGGGWMVRVQIGGDWGRLEMGNRTLKKGR